MYAGRGQNISVNELYILSASSVPVYVVYLLTEHTAVLFATPSRHSFRRKTKELYMLKVTSRKPLIFVI